MSSNSDLCTGAAGLPASDRGGRRPRAGETSGAGRVARKSVGDVDARVSLDFARDAELGFDVANGVYGCAKASTSTSISFSSFISLVELRVKYK